MNAAQSALVVHTRGWSAPVTHPGMGTGADAHRRIGLSSRYLLRDGQPWIPVSGEIHYSRVPQERWRERLLLMRSGGITVISSYVIWIHHEPVKGEASFDGNLDVAAFVRLCAELGFHVVLRIGPWAHGEVRNGGFPDWVQSAPVTHRTNDPAYLALVQQWFDRLGHELADLCGQDSAVIGIQLENELYDQPEHLRTLKGMARQAGLTAPLYTATAWGGAELPDDEVFPLYSGYGDGFWVDSDAPWNTTFRGHFFFSDEWDDVGVGADVRGIDINEAQTRPRNDSFPPATCELGGGMATTYHRRIVPTGQHIAAVANAKIGSGSAWQGYYMYAGGLNPRGPIPFQESQATGYPNDLPTVDYDFHAAIGAAGQLAPSHSTLRNQHAFLAAFGEQLAQMPPSFPERMPQGVEDMTTLRWAVRTDGTTGFLFVNWDQPHIPLPILRDVHLEVQLDMGSLRIGAGPLDIYPGTIARWPMGVTVGGLRVNWATGSVLTLLDSRTLVLLAEPGRDVEIAIDGDPSVHHIDGEAGGTLVLGHGATAARIVVIGRRDTHRVWVLEEQPRRLVLSDEPLWVDNGELVVRASTPPRVSEWAEGEWRDVQLHPDAAPSRPTAITSLPVRAASEPLPGYGEVAGRPSAPQAEDISARAAEYQLEGIGERDDTTRREISILWAGDIAQLLVDGVVQIDRFWDGSPWHIDLDAIDGAERGRVSLRVLGLHRDSPVRVPADAEARRRATAGALNSVDMVEMARSTLWRLSQ